LEFPAIGGIVSDFAIRISVFPGYGSDLERRREMRSGRIGMFAVAGFLFLTAGCMHYYKVSDPAGHKEYYTTEVETTSSGAIKIKDEKSGANVTLQSSEVKEISGEEFDKAVKGSKAKPE
jgi:hypothetical protein